MPRKRKDEEDPDFEENDKLDKDDDTEEEDLEINDFEEEDVEPSADDLKDFEEFDDMIETKAGSRGKKSSKFDDDDDLGLDNEFERDEFDDEGGEFDDDF